MSSPYYLNPKATKLGAGPDDTLQPSEEPTDATTRMLAPSTWPWVNRALGPMGPPDAPAGPRGVDPMRRGLAPFSWPGYVEDLAGDLDPDLALWPGIVLTRWPFTGPPTTGVWPLGWMGVDNTATIWVCTAGGQPGTWLPLGPGDTLGIVTPQQFGAYGDGAHDDTAAVLAASSAAQLGELYFPPGTYNCSAALTYYPGQMWRGAGRNASTIRLTVDLGSTAGNPVPFITPAPGITNYNNAVIKDLHIQGPGVFNVPPWGNSLHCHTNGIRTGGGAVYSNLYVTTFFAGVEIVNNHESLYNVFSTQNYYGVSFSDAATTNGNQTFVACNFIGNSLASIHLSTRNTINTCSFVQTHVGFNPIGILRTNTQSVATPWDGNDNPIYLDDTVPQPFMNPGITNTVFEGIDFEQIGNCGYLDGSVGDSSGGGGTLSFVGSSFMRGLLFIWNTSTKSTQAPFCNVAANQGAWTWSIRTSDAVACIEGNWPVGTQGGILCAAASYGPRLILPVVPATLVGSYDGTNSYTSLYRGVITAGGAGNVAAQGGPYQQSCIQITKSAATNVVTAGDLIEVATTAYVNCQRASGTWPIFGVAVTASPANSSVGPIVAFEGVVFLGLTIPGNIGPGARTFYQSATTRYLCDNTSTTGRAVGIQWVQNDGGTNFIRALLRLQPI
jgi:hypothetical protein